MKEIHQAISKKLGGLTMPAKMSVEEKFMKEALKQAKKAEAIGEVPIGCVIVHQDKIIARGYNRRNIENSTLAHA